LQNTIDDEVEPDVGLTGGAIGFFEEHPSLLPAQKIAQKEGVEIVEILGHGGYGIIYHVRKGNTDLALKVAQLKHTNFFTNSLHHEAELMDELSKSHSGILSIVSHGIIDDREYILMPKVDPIVPRNSRDVVSLEEALDVTIQVANAIKYCHEQGVEHRDVSRGNIGRLEGRVVLFDFGIAQRKRFFDDPDLFGIGHMSSEITFAFKEGYTPPQALEGKTRFGEYDTYALGVLLYKLATGFCPVSSDPDLIREDISRQKEFELFEDRFKKLGPNMRAYLFNALHVGVPHSIRGNVLSKNLVAIQGIDYIVQKAIHQYPQHRYRSSNDLLGDLVVFQESRENQLDISVPNIF
jgi:serine/threonine protein kinase